MLGVMLAILVIVLVASAAKWILCATGDALSALVVLALLCFLGWLLWLVLMAAAGAAMGFIGPAFESAGIGLLLGASALACSIALGCGGWACARLSVPQLAGAALTAKADGERIAFQTATWNGWPRVLIGSSIVAAGMFGWFGTGAVTVPQGPALRRATTFAGDPLGHGMAFGRKAGARASAPLQWVALSAATAAGTVGAKRLLLWLHRTRSVRACPHFIAEVEDGIRRLQPLDRDIGAIAATLGLDWPEARVAHFVAGLPRVIPAAADARLATDAERHSRALLEADLAGLKRAARQRQDVLGEMAGARARANDRTDAQLEISCVESALRTLTVSLLPCREWQRFEAAMKRLEAVLQSIASNAQQGRQRTVTAIEEALRTLGLQRAASKDDVKRAYRRAAFAHHPDRGGDATEFTRVTRAYEAVCTHYGY